MISKRVAVLVGVFTVWASAQARAAPSCKAVFFDSNEMIQELADLRLEIDLAQIQGVENSEFPVEVLLGKFNQTFSYFIENRIYSAAELRALIKHEGLKKQELRKEHSRREQDARELERLQTAFARPVEVGPEFTALEMGASKISFIDRQQALVYSDRGLLKVLRLNNGQTETIPEAVAFDFNALAGKIIYITKKLELYEYDLAERQSHFIAKVPAGFDTQRLRLELSPEAESFALILDDQVEIFKTKTGQYLGKTDISHGTSIGQRIRNLRFIDDGTVVFDGGPRLFKFEISTGLRTIVRSTTSAIAQWELAADRNHIAIESQRDLVVFSLKDNIQVDGGIKYFTNEQSNRRFTFIHGSDKPLVFFRHSDRLGIFDLRSLKDPVFDFDYVYSVDVGGARELINMATSEDGKKAVVIFSDSSTKKNWVEFWSLDFNK